MQIRKIPDIIVFVIFFLLSLHDFSHAESYLVLVDNSQTIRRPTKSPLNITYLKDIISVLKKSGPHKFYFGPIGDPDNQERLKNVEKPWIISSESKTDDISVNAPKVFDFNDLYTKIDKSLKEIENSIVFKETENIIIISDMEPDFQIKATPWSFDSKDFRDFKKYFQRLDKWVGSMDKKLTIILHGWGQTPSIGDKNKLSSFKQDLNYAIKLTSNGYPIPGKDLVRTGIYILRKRYEDKIRLLNIPVWVGKNEVNKEGFINKLCGCLPVDDPKELICTKSVKTDFKVLVNLSRRMHVNDFQIQRLESDISREIYAGPKRDIVRLEIKKKYSPEHSLNYDYQFSVRGGKGEAFRKPKVRVSFLDNSGAVDSKEELKDTPKLSSYDDLITWLKNMIENNLQEYIMEDYPILLKPKKIFLKDYNDINIPKGYRFYAKWRESPKDDKLKRCPAARIEENDGIVWLKLPRMNPKFPLFLKARLPNGKSMDREISLIKHDLVKKREDIHLKIDKRHFMQTSLNFSGLGNTPARIRVYLKDGTSLYEVYSGEKNPENNSMEISLLPGNYEIEAEPVENEKILQSFRNYIIRPEQLDSDNKGDFVLHFKEDPLSGLKNSSWEREVFGDAMTEDLTAKQKSLAVTSPNFLKALLSLTSDHLETSEKELEDFWKKLYEFYFDKSQQATYERVMRRAFINIGLVDAHGQLSPDSFTMVQSMFEMFIYGKSSWIKGSRDDVIDRRKIFNEWIDSIAGILDEEKFVSSELAVKLKFNRTGGNTL